MRDAAWYRWVPGVAVAIARAGHHSVLLDEPLTTHCRAQMNERLKGYTATVAKLDFHPIGFAIDLRDVALIQDANPDPPVMKMERLSANVQWSALFRGRLVADFELVRPTLYIDRNHLEAEQKDDVPVTDHGWQEALQAIYPLKINNFRIRDGDVTYVEAGQRRLWHASSRCTPGTKRSQSGPGDFLPLRVGADLRHGRLTVDGTPDFLAERTRRQGNVGSPHRPRYSPVSRGPHRRDARNVLARASSSTAPVQGWISRAADGLQAVIYTNPGGGGQAAVKRRRRRPMRSNDPGSSCSARDDLDQCDGGCEQGPTPNYPRLHRQHQPTVENSRTKVEAMARPPHRPLHAAPDGVDLVMRAENNGRLNLNGKIENTERAR